LVAVFGRLVAVEPGRAALLPALLVDEFVFGAVFVCGLDCVVAGLDCAAGLDGAAAGFAAGLGAGAAGFFCCAEAKPSIARRHSKTEKARIRLFLCWVGFTVASLQLPLPLGPPSNLDKPLVTPELLPPMAIPSAAEFAAHYTRGRSTPAATKNREVPWLVPGVLVTRGGVPRL
jgi:hypothetical protein